MIILCLSKHQNYLNKNKTRGGGEGDGNNSEIRDYFEPRKHAIKTN